MESWNFIESPAGGWYWLCSDVLSRKTRTSAATFQTRTECIVDAIGCGYQKGSGAQAVAKHMPHRHPARPRSGRHKRS